MIALEKCSILLAEITTTEESFILFGREKVNAKIELNSQLFHKSLQWFEILETLNVFRR